MRSHAVRRCGTRHFARRRTANVRIAVSCAVAHTHIRGVAGARVCLG